MDNQVTDATKRKLKQFEYKQRDIADTAPAMDIVNNTTSGEGIFNQIESKLESTASCY